MKKKNILFNSTHRRGLANLNYFGNNCTFALDFFPSSFYHNIIIARRFYKNVSIYICTLVALNFSTVFLIYCGCKGLCWVAFFSQVRPTSLLWSWEYVGRVFYHKILKNSTDIFSSLRPKAGPGCSSPSSGWHTHTDIIIINY